MAIKTFTSGEVLTAADTNAYLANSGLTFVTQVTGTTGTTSVNNCFSSTYDNYRILVSSSAFSANTAMNLRMRVAGSDDTSTNYIKTENSANQAGTAGSAGQNNTDAWGGLFVASANANTSLVIDLFSPFPATRTWGTYQFFGYDSANFVARHGGLLKDETTSFDGISVIMSSGSATLTITVYGYRKS